MHQHHKILRSLIITLTIAGVLPFVAYPVAIEYYGYDSALLLAPFLSYCNVIISFMCGTLWGNTKSAHNVSEPRKVKMILVSVLVFLISWFSFNMLDADLQVKVYALLFVILLGLDFILYRQEHFPRWYYLVRVATTTLVLVSILFSLRYV